MTTCNGDDAPPEARPELARFGASFGWFRSDLRFGGVPDLVPVHRSAVLVSAEVPKGRFTYALALGADLFGDATVSGKKYLIGPGWISSVSIAYRILDGSGKLPFLLAQASLSAGGSVAREEVGGLRSTFVTIDVKGGLTLGKTFFSTLSPYASIRAFGGPVLWSAQKQVGTDAYHYQPALGLVVTPTRRLAIFGEGAFLGERAITGGISVGF